MSNTLNTKKQKNNRLLDGIEKVGNKIPHPFYLFLILIGVVVVLTAILSAVGVTAISPTTNEVLTVKNFLSFDGLAYLIVNFVSNYQGMFILGAILCLSVASSVCEETGLYDAAIKASIKNTKGVWVVIIVSFVGVLANAAGDAAWILVPPIAGMIFFGTGRNPIAGMFCGYAAAAGGFSTEIVPGFDVILAPITSQAAEIVMPGFKLPFLSGYFALFISSFIVTGITAFVTLKFIEPRLGPYTKTPPASIDTTITELTPLQKKGLKRAGISLLVYFAVLIIACIPSTSFLRGPDGSLIFDAPLMDGIQFLMIVMFILPGVVYGITTKKIQKPNDFVNIMVTGAQGVAPFLVILFAVAQFINIFNDSNLGAVLAINGGNFLKRLNAPSLVIILVFILIVAFINIFIGSAGTKWMLLAPVFVPMLMQLDFHPAFIQFAYRLGDCITNPVTPLMAYMAILLTNCKKYDESVGLGTIISCMSVYSVFYLIAQLIFVTIWFLTGLPVGINGPIFMS